MGLLLNIQVFLSKRKSIRDKIIEILHENLICVPNSDNIYCKKYKLEFTLFQIRFAFGFQLLQFFYVPSVSKKHNESGLKKPNYRMENLIASSFRVPMAALCPVLPLFLY